MSLKPPKFQYQIVDPKTGKGKQDFLNFIYSLWGSANNYEEESSSFVSVAKNLKSWNYTESRDVNGYIETITYTNQSASILKTYNRDGNGYITSIVLSGDTPNGIALTLTISRDSNGYSTGGVFT